jgi:hypothetical protein
MEGKMHFWAEISNQTFSKVLQSSFVITMYVNGVGDKASKTPAAKMSFSEKHEESSAPSDAAPTVVKP